MKIQSISFMLSFLQMPAVRVVTFLILLTGISCSPNLNHDTDNEQETPQITKGKTKNGGCIIAGHCYDFEKTNIIPAGIVINGVVLEAEDGFFQYHVWPGDYDIRAGFIGRKWALRSVKIEKGDSVHVNFYLEDDDTPLVHEK
jgi:hypothetical protein